MLVVDPAQLPGIRTVHPELPPETPTQPASLSGPYNYRAVAA
jgi:hypothetical protein